MQQWTKKFLILSNYNTQGLVNRQVLFKLTPVKSIKELIEESNVEFANADAAGKRVMIAQDILERIKLNNILAYSGNFFKNQLGFSKKYEGKGMKEVLNDSDARCEVCAKGALFCGIIGRVNELTVDDFKDYNFSVSSYGDRGHEKLLEFFTLQQIDLIETAFEGTSFLDICNLDDSINAENFRNEYMTSKQVMTAIMQNIIRNKGEFIP